MRPPSDTDDEDDRTPPPKKRARILTYVKCEQNFDGSHPVENKCRWHTGVLEADYESDIWMEHEGEFHGLIDTEKKNRRSFPEGFKWSCCGRGGDRRGCKKGFNGAFASASASGHKR